MMDFVRSLVETKGLIVFSRRTATVHEERVGGGLAEGKLRVPVDLEVFRLRPPPT
jgi:hypothetical protein